MAQGTLLGFLLALFVAAPAEKPADKSSNKVSVSLRAAPRSAVAPARIVFNVELKGGDDTEALHCLTLQWEWGDGTKSSTEGDCSPFEAGQTRVQRLFTADHEYREQRRPTAEVTVLKGERVVGRAFVDLTIGPRPTRPKFEGSSSTGQ
jgi:hypothetical protein